MWNTFVGWFTEFIKLMYSFTGSIGFPNYGLAIILMSIAIKAVLFPLTQKQMKSMREMQEIQPRMKYLQTQYKDDPQLMQRKLQELYKEHGVNPLGGCLPLLIQMPILFAFYRSLYTFQFAVPAHAIFLGINIAEKVTSQSLIAWILPIMVAATTFYQQKISMADTNDPTQKSMLYMMPLFIGYISSTVQAGLPLYWVTFNLLSIAQQLYVNATSKKVAVAGAGSAIEVQEIGTLENVGEPETGGKEEAGRDKGGTSQDGSPNRRKKGKKH
ncbi:MAG TPA: YidC/Oxa1 family membrane protein insertase [Syntrophomonadaceae bacterium]|nr:YidC/Oxa1 family membrane protein insertase [Syntrophomonadaceae bacterium]